MPGFMSAASYVAILSILPDGLRPGEFMISTIFPKDKDKNNVLLLSMVVFDTYRFGPQSIVSFAARFPRLPLAVFFVEVLFSKFAEMYLKSLTGKNKEKQMSVSVHSHVFNSSAICAICNVI